MSGNGESVAANASNGSESSVWCWSCRCTVAILGCLSLMNMHAQQMAMSASLGCMLNSSFVVHHILSLDAQNDPYMCEQSTSFKETLQHNQSSYSVRLKRPHIEISGSVAWERYAQNLILGAFLWGYLFSLGIAGLFAFKSSAHKLLGYSQLAMSLATLMTPIASLYMHTYAVIGLQFMAGLGAGATYPGIMAILLRWAPPGERTRLSAVTFCGIPLGVMIATSSIQVTCYYTRGSGWSALFYSLGLFGFLWFVLWMTLVSSCPEKSRRISEAERQYISKSLGCHDTVFDQGDIPWRNVFCSRLLWSVVPIHFTTDWGLYLLICALPIYLRDVKHTDINRFSNGYFSTAPFAAFLVMALVFGLLADCLLGCCMCLVETIRKIYATAGVLGFSAGIVLLTFIDCEDWLYLVVILTAITGLHGLQYYSSLITPMDKCPKYATIIVTFSQTVAQLLKIIGIYVSNSFSSEGGKTEWHIILYASSVVAVISGAIFLLFAGGKLQTKKADNFSLSLTNEELSSAFVEQGSSRSAEEFGISNHQEPHLKPFLVDQEMTRLGGISLGLRDHAENQMPSGLEAGGCLSSNSYSSLSKDQRRKVPLVSVV